MTSLMRWTSAGVFALAAIIATRPKPPPVLSGHHTSASKSPRPLSSSLVRMPAVYMNFG